MSLRRLTFHSMALATAVLITIGCGGESKEKDGKSTASKSDANESNPNKSKPKETSDSKGKENQTKQKSKPVRVVSKLPYKDVDPMSAEKGVEPGRVLIDANGQDSNGKQMKLSDYKGKVILLDVWASW